MCLGSSSDVALAATPDGAEVSARPVRWLLLRRLAAVLDWRVLPAFAATALFLGWLRNLPDGPWTLLYDDGVWTSIVHRWCGGARLYAELWARQAAERELEEAAE